MIHQYIKEKGIKLKRNYPKRNVIKKAKKEPKPEKRSFVFVTAGN